MKAAFQKWAQQNVGQADFSGHHGKGGVWIYSHNIMQLAWECWQAASSACAPSSTATPEVFGLPVTLDYHNEALGDTGDYVGHTVLKANDGTELARWLDNDDGIPEAICVALNLRMTHPLAPSAIEPVWRHVSEDNPQRGVAWVDWSASHVGKIGVKGKRYLLALPAIRSDQTSVAADGGASKA